MTLRTRIDAATRAVLTRLRRCDTRSRSADLTRLAAALDDLHGCPLVDRATLRAALWCGLITVVLWWALS